MRASLRPCAAAGSIPAEPRSCASKFPLGNGRNFGFVRSSRKNGPSGNGGDSDLDGVPNVLDVASSGSLVLNALRAESRSAPSPRSLLTPFWSALELPLRRRPVLSPAPRPGPEPGSTPGPEPGAGPGAPDSRWMSQIFLDIPNTLNADAAGVTREQIDAMLVENLNAKLLDVPEGDLVKLDCHGLSYCSHRRHRSSGYKRLVLRSGYGRACACDQAFP